MSRAQTVWTLSALAAVAAAVVLFLYLPFSFWVNSIIAGLAFCIISGLGHRYFRRHATPEEIRADIEAGKNSPG